MPNWCSNWMSISGEAIEIERFISGGMADDEGDISFLSTYYPVPPELESEILTLEEKEQRLKKYGHADWESWCKAHWGTKKAEFDLTMDYEDGQVIANFEFCSAGSPPLEGYGEISRQFPTIEFQIHYEEPECGFSGDAVIQNGEIDDYCREYSDEDDEDEDEDEEETEIAG